MTYSLFDQAWDLHTKAGVGDAWPVLFSEYMDKHYIWKTPDVLLMARPDKNPDDDNGLDYDTWFIYMCIGGEKALRDLVLHMPYYMPWLAFIKAGSLEQRDKRYYSLDKFAKKIMGEEKWDLITTYHNHLK